LTVKDCFYSLKCELGTMISTSMEMLIAHSGVFEKNYQVELNSFYGCCAVLLMPVYCDARKFDCRNDSMICWMKCSTTTWTTTSQINLVQ